MTVKLLPLNMESVVPVEWEHLCDLNIEVGTSVRFQKDQPVIE